MGRFHWTILLIILVCQVSIQHVEAQGRKKRAKEEESKSSQRNLLQAEVIFLEGEKYFMIEDYHKALIFFQKSLELNPDNSACHYKVGQILMLGEEYDKALIYAAKSVQLSPKNKFYYLQKRHSLSVFFVRIILCGN